MNVNEQGNLGANDGDPTTPNEIGAKLEALAVAVEEDRKTFDDLLDLAKTLIEDFASLREVVKTMGPSPHLRRIFVRTSYSNCEGFVWVMKQLAVRSGASFDPPLTDSERALLNDMMPRLHDSGEVREEKAKVTLAQNVLFLAKVLKRMKDCGEFELQPRSEGWRNFFEGVKVRDRLTHPKRASEMQVSDDEMTMVRDGVLWLTNSLQTFIRIRRNAVRTRRNEATTALIAEALAHGATEEQIALFIQRVDPNYNGTPQSQNAALEPISRMG